MWKPVDGSVQEREEQKVLAHEDIEREDCLILLKATASYPHSWTCARSPSGGGWIGIWLLTTVSCLLVFRRFYDRTHRSFGPLHAPIRAIV